MPDIEVEKTLREIRDRVHVKMREQAPAKVLSLLPKEEQQDGRSLESLKANLAVIERSWNKLPPLTSYRAGWLARLELWLKHKLKRATHWFTWEQINFNAATANSLKEVSRILSDQERALAQLQTEMSRLTKAMESQMGLHTRQARQFDFDSVANFLIADPTLNADKRPDENKPDPDVVERQQEIDRQIQILSKRLEELRTTKSKLELTVGTGLTE